VLTADSFTINNKAKPYYAELDIYEGVNNFTHNQMTIWSNLEGGCQDILISNSRLHQRDDTRLTRAYWEDADGTFGAPVNAAGGVVSVMSLDSDGIRMWHFAPADIPKDLDNDTPDVNSWKAPVVSYDSGSAKCNLGQIVTDQMMVLKLDFCGTMAGADNWINSGCQTKSEMTCNEFVGTNPQAFSDTYFAVNYVKLFKSTRPLDNAPVDTAGGTPSSIAESATSQTSIEILPTNTGILPTSLATSQPRVETASAISVPPPTEIVTSRRMIRTLTYPSTTLTVIAGPAVFVSIFSVPLSTQVSCSTLIRSCRGRHFTPTTVLKSTSRADFSSQTAMRRRVSATISTTELFATAQPNAGPPIGIVLSA
jgi:hypothetical protein